jgi:hypothetical protein
MQHQRWERWVKATHTATQQQQEAVQQHQHKYLQPASIAGPPPMSGASAGAAASPRALSNSHSLAKPKCCAPALLAYQLEITRACRPNQQQQQHVLA